MMWVMFALSLIELAAVHLLVALRWPLVGWPLTIISAIGALYILYWIHSFRRRPHELDGDQITLRLGALKSVTVPLESIKRVRTEWEQGVLQAKSAVNLAGIAFPNRCLELNRPVKHSKTQVYVRLDQPEPFDQALTTRGIPVV